MFKNNIIFFVILAFLLMSCETLQSVKRGITGEKNLSTDEFLVQKKDPLILPPDFEKIKSKFVIVSRVLPDFETIIMQEFFKFLILRNCKYKSSSRLSKKNTFFLILVLKNE